jgi:uncharacterized cupredoxin-like copper-binding protein
VTGVRKSSIRLAVVALALVALAPSCSAGHEPRHGTDLAVTLRDFHVRLGHATVSAGLVSFDVHNLGPSTHEFLVVRTGLQAGHLPIGTDGLRVDEESPLLHPVKEDSELDLGDAHVLAAKLPPGHYVLYCNLEGHYLGGMYASLTVR